MNQNAIWWTEIRSHPTKLNDWLVDQYHSYNIAAKRIRESIILHLEEFDNDGRDICNRMASNHERHAAMIKQLMNARSIGATSVLDAHSFMWNEYNEESNAEAASAVMAHLSKFHMEHVSAIIGDSETPSDIKSIMQQVYKDMMYHMRALTTLAGTEMTKVRVTGNLDNVNLFI